MNSTPSESTAAPYILDSVYRESVCQLLETERDSTCYRFEFHGPGGEEPDKPLAVVRPVTPALDEIKKEVKKEDPRAGKKEMREAVRPRAPGRVSVGWFRRCLVRLLSSLFLYTSLLPPPPRGSPRQPHAAAERCTPTHGAAALSPRPTPHTAPRPAPGDEVRREDRLRRGQGGPLHQLPQGARPPHHAQAQHTRAGRSHHALAPAHAWTGEGRAR